VKTGPSKGPSDIIVISIMKLEGQQWLPLTQLVEQETLLPNCLSTAQGEVGQVKSNWALQHGEVFVWQGARQVSRLCAKRSTQHRTPGEVLQQLVDLA